MKLLKTWTTEDFDSMSWHDVHVHGFRLDSYVESAGCADLVLDIDYLLEWSEIEEGFEFNVAKAELRFHEVFGLKFALDYPARSAGMCPFALDCIEREAVAYPTGFETFRWKLLVNWPQGLLEFEAPRFTQTLTDKSRLQRAQVIS